MRDDPREQMRTGGLMFGGFVADGRRPGLADVSAAAVTCPLASCRETPAPLGAGRRADGSSSSSPRRCPAISCRATIWDKLAALLVYAVLGVLLHAAAVRRPPRRHDDDDTPRWALALSTALRHHRRVPPELHAGRTPDVARPRRGRASAPRSASSACWRSRQCAPDRPADARAGDANLRGILSSPLCLLCPAMSLELPTFENLLVERDDAVGDRDRSIGRRC